MKSELHSPSQREAPWTGEPQEAPGRVDDVKDLRSLVRGPEMPSIKDCVLDEGLRPISPLVMRWSLVDVRSPTSLPLISQSDGMFNSDMATIRCCWS